MWFPEATGAHNPCRACETQECRPWPNNRCGNREDDIGLETERTVSESLTRINSRFVLTLSIDKSNAYFTTLLRSRKIDGPAENGTATNPSRNSSVHGATSVFLGFASAKAPCPELFIRVRTNLNGPLGLCGKIRERCETKMDQRPIKGLTPSKFHFVHAQAVGGVSQVAHNKNSGPARRLTLIEHQANSLGMMHLRNQPRINL